MSLEMEMERLAEELARGGLADWAASSEHPEVQQTLARADDRKGRDIEWARRSPLLPVRVTALCLDWRKGRPLYWALDDKVRSMVEAATCLIGNPRESLI
jgi:hypothetical protein